MQDKLSIIVVGAGVFGASTAVELARRGHTITLMDPGPIPHPRAASTDISKAVRMDYGSDEFYMSLMEEALSGWDRWNVEWDEPLYHEDGFLVLSAEEMRPGKFEYESFQLLRKRGHNPQRLNSATLKSRFPAWNADNYSDGYFNPRAGWGESAKVVEHLIQEAKSGGVSLREGLSAVRLQDDSARVTGVVGSDGQAYRADLVIVAMGTWSPILSPSLKGLITHVAQPIFYFQPDDVENYQPDRFPVWAADLSRTGWYGFPATKDGTVKVSNHGPGRQVLPDDDRKTTQDDEIRCRNFLNENLPGLADGRLANSRTCLYCDTWDGDFYIDHVPEWPGLVIATGGSGHAFKFTPMLGRIVADVVERKPNQYAARFAWRERGGATAKEQARYQG
jgi:glycine/D-amino acid oxidase-like deaminating enzyme